MPTSRLGTIFCIIFRSHQGALIHGDPVKEGSPKCALNSPADFLKTQTMGPFRKAIRFLFPLPAAFNFSQHYCIVLPSESGALMCPKVCKDLFVMD